MPQRVTAKAMAQRGTGAIFINDIVKEHLDAIDIALRNATMTKSKSLRYGLPTTFPESSLSYEELKLVVHAKIIRDLESRGFAVKYEDDKVEVTWASMVGEEDVRDLEAFLNSRRTAREPPAVRTREMKGPGLTAVERTLLGKR